MSLQPGTRTFGPADCTLSVRTGRSGAAAKAGHDLLIDVTAWQATLEVGEDPARTSVVLNADGRSLRVREGTGGMQALSDEDKAGIEQTIDDEVLMGQGIEFRSTAVNTAADGSRLSVQGELTLVGRTCPIAFDLAVGADGELSGSALVKQTDWEIAPYSTLFGALKVADEVEVAIDAGARRADSDVADGPTPSALDEGRSRPIRLRPPRVGPRVSSFLWALVFFLYLWLGLVAVGFSHGIALPVALVASSLIFLFIYKQGAGRQSL